MSKATLIEDTRKQALREALAVLTPAQREALAARLPARAAQPRLVAAVVPKPGDGATPNMAPEALRAWLRARLPEYMLPASIELMSALPTLPNGKVDRTALARRSWATPAAVATATGLGQMTPDADVAAVEQKLADIWSAVLGVSLIDRMDDFFELGGDSITGMRVVSRANRAGVLIGINDLFSRRTLAAVAEGVVRAQSAPQAQTGEQGDSVTQPAAPIDQSATQAGLRQTELLADLRHVIPINPAGNRPPLFMVHQGTGSTFGYENLPRYLGADQPLYGFRESGWEEGDTRPQSLEQMAQDYVRELRHLQPHGPYHMGGFCFGGIVAYEMARQLRQSGEEVASLYLIDAIAPNVSFHDQSIERRRSNWADLRQLPLPAKSAFFVKLVRRRAHWAITNRYTALRDKLWLGVYRFNTRHNLPVSPTIKGLSFMYHNFALQQRYRGGNYDGDAVVIRAIRTHLPPDDGWNTLVVRPVKICQMKTEGHLAMLMEPHVRELAAYLREHIDRSINRLAGKQGQAHAR
jgi:thioesterase domain-containing protein/aryl carrier-like protein